MPTWLKWLSGLLLLNGIMIQGDDHVRAAVMVGLTIALFLTVIWVLMTPLISLVEYLVPARYVSQAGSLMRGLRWLLCGFCVLSWLLWLIPAP